MPTRSYLSQSEKAVTFGLGKHEKIDKVVIYWAGFKPQELGAVAVDKLHRVDQQ
jgi:hypothetical protein